MINSRLSSVTALSALSFLFVMYAYPTTTFNFTTVHSGGTLGGTAP